MPRRDTAADEVLLGAAVLETPWRHFVRLPYLLPLRKAHGGPDGPLGPTPLGPKRPLEFVHDTAFVRDYQAFCHICTWFVHACDY